MNSILKDYLPPITLRVMRRIRSDLRFRKYDHKDILKRNHELKMKGRGRRAFLIATGPSLKQEDLTLLAGEDCFSISNFFLHEALDVVQPKYHFFAPYHEPLILENYVDWLRDADRRLPAETGIFLGHTGFPLVEKYRLFSHREVRYLYLSDAVSGLKIDLAEPVLAPQTGVIMILPVLAFMGYPEIYLLGCDHTVLRNYGGVIDNFYDSALDRRENATSAKCWGKIIDSHMSSMNVFLQYEFYKKIFDQQRVVVKNLSKDTWLESFPVDDLKKICNGVSKTEQ